MTSLVDMKLFTLEPRDVLMVRDGRAMNASVGRSLPIAPPATIAGLVRTRLGSTKGRFDRNKIEALLTQVAVGGPLLAKLSEDGRTVADVLVPVPGDVVWFDGVKGVFGRRLVARTLDELAPGAAADLVASAGAATVPAFAGAMSDWPREKSAKRPPRFWSWDTLRAWLTRSEDTEVSPSGYDALPRELRTHVGIEAQSQTASDGVLFATEGVRYARREPSGWARYAMVAGYASQLPGAVEAWNEALLPLGGERRVAFADGVADGALKSKLACPKEISALKAGALARVVLVTPALFDEGAVPATIAGAQVITAKVDRPEVVSGWDFALDRPKPSRRMAPASSVFWVRVPDDEWARRTWLTCVSSNPQDQRDGFGLAVVGTV